MLAVLKEIKQFTYFAWHLAGNMSMEQNAGLSRTKNGTVWLETVELRQKKTSFVWKDAVAELQSSADELRTRAKEDRILAGACAIPEMELSRELGMPQPAITSAIQPEEL